MVPRNEADARLSDKAIALSRWTASAIIEGESALPLLSIGHLKMVTSLFC